jgi:hypothetical protein
MDSNQPSSANQTSGMTQPPKQKHEQHQSSGSQKASQAAKAGQPLRPDEKGVRSPKQENL